MEWTDLPAEGLNGEEYGGRRNYAPNTRRASDRVGSIEPDVICCSTGLSQYRQFNDVITMRSPFEVLIYLLNSSHQASSSAKYVQ